MKICRKENRITRDLNSKRGGGSDWVLNFASKTPMLIVLRVLSASQPINVGSGSKWNRETEVSRVHRGSGEEGGVKLEGRRPG